MLRVRTRAHMQSLRCRHWVPPNHRMPPNVLPANLPIHLTTPHGVWAGCGAPMQKRGDCGYQTLGHHGWGASAPKQKIGRGWPCCFPMCWAPWGGVLKPVSEGQLQCPYKAVLQKNKPKGGPEHWALVGGGNAVAVHVVPNQPQRSWWGCKQVALLSKRIVVSQVSVTALGTMVYVALFN